MHLVAILQILYMKQSLEFITQYMPKGFLEAFDPCFDEQLSSVQIGFARAMLTSWQYVSIAGVKVQGILVLLMIISMHHTSYKLRVLRMKI